MNTQTSKLRNNRNIKINRKNNKKENHIENKYARR